MSFVKRMIMEINDYDCVVPKSGDDLLEPLFAIYKKRIRKTIKIMLDSNETKVQALFERVRTKYIYFEDSGWYTNLNSAHDYNDYISRTGKHDI